MDDILLVGAGGHAKSIIEIIQKNNQYNIVGIIDKKRSDLNSIMGIPIIGEDNDLPHYFKKEIEYAFVSVGSIGYSAVRHKLSHWLEQIGFFQPSIIAKNAGVYPGIQLKSGTLLGKGCQINAETQIGKMVIINTGAIVEHECSIGEYAHIGPGTTVCGNVSIGADTHIGAGTTIIQSVTIGKGVIIGAGSVVTKDIPDYCTAVGVPAKPIKFHDEGEK